MRDENSAGFLFIVFVAFLVVFLYVQSCEISALEASNEEQQETIRDLEHNLMIEQLIRREN